MDVDSILADAETTQVDPQGLKDVSFLAKQALDMAQEIAALEETLKQRKKDYMDMLRNTLPDAMDAAGVSEFATSNGSKVSIKQIVAASISAKNKPEAFAWLRENNHGDMIKYELSARFGTGEGNVVAAVKDSLAKEFGIAPEEKESVHPQTLGAFCREQLAAGADLPEDILGLYIGREAKINVK
jgi:hypothetical protein